MTSEILALILAMSIEANVPPYFVQAIALTEHWGGSVENTEINPKAISLPNKDGSVDRGVMQLNSRYYDHVDWSCPETNIREGIALIKSLSKEPLLNTWWAVAVAYNCGYAGFVSGPPSSSIDYGSRVISVWSQLEDTRFISVIIRDKKSRKN